MRISACSNEFCTWSSFALMVSRSPEGAFRRVAPSSSSNRKRLATSASRLLVQVDLHLAPLLGQVAKLLLGLDGDLAPLFLQAAQRPRRLALDITPLDLQTPHVPHVLLL